MKANPSLPAIRLFLCLILCLPVTSVMADVTVGGDGEMCSEDSACINRLHPDIPMAARAKPGERILMIGRDAGDLNIDPDKFASGDSSPRLSFGVVHPLTGFVPPASRAPPRP